MSARTRSNFPATARGKSERSLALRNPRSVTAPSLPLLSFSLLLLPSLGFWIRTQSGISRNAGVSRGRSLWLPRTIIAPLRTGGATTPGGAGKGRQSAVFFDLVTLPSRTSSARPREQVADAEALFDIANTLLTSVRSQTSNGVTPSDFVTALLRNFGQQQGRPNIENIPVFNWSDVGHAASHVFMTAPGFPMM
ncbi:hypothetical protein GW17_00048631 [Ensete ventricosum]|nr:hypothetical protein GW17_00048631 [Ensete ventricosum]